MENVIWRASFAQAFNFYLQSRGLTPPGYVSPLTTLAQASEDEIAEATKYAKAMADLAYTSHMAIYSPDKKPVDS